MKEEVEGPGETGEEPSGGTDRVIDRYGPGPGRTTGIVGPSGVALMRCDWCRGIWDPGKAGDCEICKRYPPVKKGKKVGPARVAHGDHSMCFRCFGVYMKARKRVRLDSDDDVHLAKAAHLRLKLVHESLYPQRFSDDEGDRPST